MTHLRSCAKTLHAAYRAIHSQGRSPVHSHACRHITGMRREATRRGSGPPAARGEGRAEGQATHPAAGEPSAGMPACSWRHLEGASAAGGSWCSPQTGPATWLAGPAKGRLPAITQMVIISRKVKLWKVPRVQESPMLNNEHTSLPLLPWDILFCIESGF